MRIDDRAVHKASLRDIILPELLNSAFHVTGVEGFDDIRRGGAVSSNRDGKPGNSYPQSANGYGRKRGYVCLFDLRGVDSARVERALQDFYFLDPFSDDRDPVFLFVRREAQSDLIPWEVARESEEMFIWHVEAWYPSELPLTHVERALRVTIDRPPDSPHIAALKNINRIGPKSEA